MMVEPEKGGRQAGDEKVDFSFRVSFVHQPQERRNHQSVSQGTHPDYKYSFRIR